MLIRFTYFYIKIMEFEKKIRVISCSASNLFKGFFLDIKKLLI